MPKFPVLRYPCNYLYYISGNSKCQSLRSIFSNEYSLNIQQQSFVANNKAVMKHMQNKFQFDVVWVLTKATLGHFRFYNFSIGIIFLPYKSTMLSLCGPLDLSAFLHSCMYMLNTNIVHIIPTSSQYSDHCLGVVWVAREYFSEVYCCLLYYSILTQPP